jgi:formate hydrogenlyase subunit 3/multisubunit Na+/H+ antiporter MnhD subunit
MQIIRVIVILFGLAIVAAGLYLFVLGVGAPIEIKSIEVGALKASATGTFVGLLVAGVGLAVSISAMRNMKRQERSRTEEEFDAEGRTTKRVTETFTVAAEPPFEA